MSAEWCVLRKGGQGVKFCLETYYLVGVLDGNTLLTYEVKRYIGDGENV